MKRSLPFVIISVFFTIACLQTKSQLLYSNNNLGSRIYNPGFGLSNTPNVIFDDINFPDSLVGKSDSIVINQVQVAIGRAPGSPAVTVNIYASSPDTAAAYDFLKSLPAVPGKLIGTLNLPAGGPSNFFTIGDGVTPLATFAADTGRFLSGYQTLYIGMSFSDSVQQNIGWYLSNGPDTNYALIYKYDVTDIASPRSSLDLVGTYNLPATMYAQVYGTFKTASPLPVTLLNFNVARQDAKNIVSWQTQTENNSDYFVVERSSDGQHFKSIGQLKAAGFSNSVLNYSFADNAPATGTNYYRLHTIDKDNRSTYSTVRIIVNELRLLFNVYPNPASNNFTASFTSASSGMAALIIRATNGQLIYSKNINVLPGTNALLIADAPLKPGIYYVSIANKDINLTGKLEKQ